MFNQITETMKFTSAPLSFNVSAIQVGLVYIGRPAEALGMGTITLAIIRQNCAFDMFRSFALPVIY